MQKMVLQFIRIMQDVYKRQTAYYDSLIKDTSNYDWVRKCTDNGFDRNLYAKWAEDSDEELETKEMCIRDRYKCI